MFGLMAEVADQMKEARRGGDESVSALTGRSLIRQATDVCVGVKATSKNDKPQKAQRRSP